MTLPPKLQSEINELADAGYRIETTEDPDCINVVFKEFLVGEGYSARASDLLIKVPRSYPDAGPDMFWLDPGIMLASGGIPQSADSIETYMNRAWRRFSWHRQGTGWNPTIDNIHSNLEFICRRLREKK